MTKIAATNHQPTKGPIMATKTTPVINNTARRDAAVDIFIEADRAEKIAKQGRAEARDLVERVCASDGKITTSKGSVVISTVERRKVDMAVALGELPDDVLLVCASSIDPERLAAFVDAGRVSQETFDAIVSIAVDRRVAVGR
jgi:hypothetical protein